MRITFYITYKHSKYFEYRIFGYMPDGQFDIHYVYRELISLLYDLRIPESDHPIELIDMATYESDNWTVQVFFL
jgi:hypothetical protein